jgi:hypothetical protein
MGERLTIARGVRACALDAAMVSRHGLIAGATGTGKTVTLHAALEALSGAGVPTLAVDAKGDLAGVSRPGPGKDALRKARERFGLPADGPGCPFVPWDLLGERGHPIRATVADFGPLLLARTLGLSEAQREVLQVAFRIADDGGLLLVDLEDLRALLRFCLDHGKALERDYGRLPSVSLTSISRAALALSEAGGGGFFGERALDVRHLARRAPDGRGIVNLLDATALIERPELYSTFALWLLSELFESFPERGDAERPEIAIFIDEAHLLFDGAPEALVDAACRTVKLARSRGIGVWFVTQSPDDLPDEVSGQLGNRVQHALRAYTPRDAKAIKAALDSFRPNPALDARSALAELATGEALVSFLGPDGAPEPVERAFVIPPGSRVGTISDEERAESRAASGMGPIYDAPENPESAYELLAARQKEAEAAERARAEEAAKAAALAELIDMERKSAPGARLSGLAGLTGDEAFGVEPGKAGRAKRRSGSGNGTSASTDPGGPMEPLADAAAALARSAGRELGRQLVRGLLGGLSGRRRR